jgi:hypothetical protein
VRSSARRSGAPRLHRIASNQPIHGFGHWRVDSKLANLSRRAFVRTGDNIVIAGFMLGGNNGGDRIVVRGIGPSLNVAGVPDALADPVLEPRETNGARLISNNDWQDNPAQAAEITAAGLAPTNSREAGVAAPLPAGLCCLPD